MPSPEELARRNIERLDSLKDWSSGDKTLSEGKARRVSARSANQYGHERAVADQVNVNYDVYKIETEITKGGSLCWFGIETLMPQGAINARRQAAHCARSTECLDQPPWHDCRSRDRY